ncbi:hypothetical protein AbraIFM66950_008186 [Aspergillus brasiliensis]|nr:hypothetical protein AbraIFM66950_008186 [Aspergillus brasiliensis]
MAGLTDPPSSSSSTTETHWLEDRAKEIVGTTLNIAVDEIERAPILDLNANTISYEVYFLQTMWSIGYVPKHPGVVRMPSGTKQVVIQFKALEGNMSQRRWAENKVAALHTARTILYNTDFLRTVPEVYAWSDGSDDEYNNSWIIHSSHPPMDTSLKNSFYEMPPEHQGDILGQIATIHKLFQEYDHMAVCQGYGGFRFTEEGYVRSGEALMAGIGGPFGSLRSYLTELLRRDLRRAEERQDIEGWQRYPELRSKLEDIVEHHVTDIVAKIPEYRPTFTLNRIDKDSRVMSRCILEGFPEGDVDIDLRELDNFAYYNDGRSAHCHYSLARNLYEALQMADVNRPQDIEGAEKLVAFLGFCAAVGGRGLYRDDPPSNADPDEVFHSKAKLVEEYLKLFGY